MARVHTLLSTHRVYFGELPFPVEISIWRNLESEWLFASASHAIKTPEQRNADVPQPGGHHQRDAEDALQEVINQYEAEFQRAINAGHEPSEEWLVREPVL